MTSTEVHTTEAESYIELVLISVLPGLAGREGLCCSYWQYSGIWVFVHIRTTVIISITHDVLDLYFTDLCRHNANGSAEGTQLTHYPSPHPLSRLFLIEVLQWQLSRCLPVPLRFSFLEHSILQFNPSKKCKYLYIYNVLTKNLYHIISCCLFVRFASFHLVPLYKRNNIELIMGSEASVHVTSLSS